MFRLSKRSVAVVSAFLFSVSFVSTGYAVDPCERCWTAYTACVHAGGKTCKAQLDQCLRRYSCL